jgi:hypothetical protein
MFRQRPGLTDTLAAQNYFLACACHPEQDIEIILPMNGTRKFKATIAGLEYASD